MHAGGEPSARLDQELFGLRSPGGLEAVAAPWSRLAAAGNPGRVSLQTVEVRRDGALVAAAIVHVIHGLAVGDYTGGALAAITSLGRQHLGVTPLAFDIGFLELPFTNRSGLMFAPGLSPAERDHVTTLVLDATRAIRVHALCVKSAPAEAPPVLSARRFARVPFVDNHVLVLPGEVPSYEQWLAQRSANRRSMIRRHVRDFDREGARLVWAHDPADHADRIEALFERTAARAQERGDLPQPMAAGAHFYRAFRAHLGERGGVRLAVVGEHVVGFLVHLYGHDTLFIKFVGLDYEASTRTRAYFRLFYDAVEEACRRGLGRVDMGSTTAQVKLPLGCEAEVSEYHIEFRRSLRVPGAFLSRMLAARFGAEAHAAPGDSPEAGGGTPAGKPAR